MGSQQKVAVITGASQGVGAGLVKGYRDRNYRVIATSRSIKQGNNSDVLAIDGDIANPRTAVRVINEGLARFGRIDTLVNNAGIFIAKPFTDYSPDDFAAILSVNVAGFFHVTQRALAQMLKQGHGHIVNITTDSRRSADRWRALSARLSDQRRSQFGNEVSCHRVCAEGHPRERGLPWHDQDAVTRTRSVWLACKAPPCGADGRDPRHC